MVAKARTSELSGDLELSKSTEIITQVGIAERVMIDLLEWINEMFQLQLRSNS